jgi:hypothetical protein
MDTDERLGSVEKRLSLLSDVIESNQFRLKQLEQRSGEWSGPYNTLAQAVQALQPQLTAPTNDPIPGSGEYQHRATPREWETLRRYGPTGNTNDSITLEIADRLAAVEQSLHQLRAVKDSLTAATASAPPELSDDYQHQAKPEEWKRVREWARRGESGPSVLCEIASYVRRLAVDIEVLKQVYATIATSVADLGQPPTPAPIIKPPELSDGEAWKLWNAAGFAVGYPDVSGADAARHIHRVVWDAAMTAVAAQQQQRPDKPPLGLKPQWLAMEERLAEVEAAINRYTEYNSTQGNEVYTGPVEWLAEANYLRRQLPRWQADTSPAPAPPADHIADANKMVEPAPAPTPEPVPDPPPSLHDMVAVAIGCSRHGEEAIDAILTIADWLDQYALHKLSAIALRQEATAPTPEPVPAEQSLNHRLREVIDDTEGPDPFGRRSSEVLNTITEWLMENGHEFAAGCLAETHNR